MKMMRKFFSLLLAVLMLLSVVPTSVSGANTYTINGKAVRFDDFSSAPDDCWNYANNIYNKIWGQRFSNSFSDSNNSLRNLNDSQLTLNATNLKKYVSHAALGSCLRICNADYLHGTDGWGHSQIIVQKDNNGFTVFEGGLTDYPHIREKYFTWDGYCSSGYLGGKYSYIKYIKWPGASAYIYDPLPTTGQCGENVYWNYNIDTKRLIISGSGEMYEESPFENSYIKSVVIENGVTTIENYAFMGCSNLTEVTMGNNITLIGDMAFNACEKLTSITIPDSVTTIGHHAFSGCSNLTEATIGKNVTSIGNGAFKDCNNVSKVNYSGDLISWMNIVFDGSNYAGYYSNPMWSGADLYFNNKLVEHIKIPDWIEEIPVVAFQGCTSLVSVELPEGIKSINYEAFYGCTNLKKINIPKSLEEIGRSAFSYCPTIDVHITDIVSWMNIKSVFGSVSGLPNATKPSYQLYLNNVKVEHLTIPSSISTLNSGCFDGCTSLKTVYIPEGVIEIGPLSFIGCSNLTSVTIPNTVTEIGMWAFGLCDKLTSITIPTSVKEIGAHIFLNCTNLKNIYYSGTEAQWKEISINQNNTVLLSDATIHYNCFVGAPSIAASPTDSTVKLTWSSVSDATVYRVYQKVGDNWRKIGDTTNTSGTIKNLTSGTKYSFAIKAGKKVGDKIVWSPDFSTVSTATKAIAPAKVASAQSTGAIKLTWNKCTGATGYRIYYKSGNTWKVCVSSTATTSHTFQNLKAGAKYTFAIRPYTIINGVVVWSDYAEYTAATIPLKVNFSVSSPSKGKITLSFSPRYGANEYQVYYKVGNGAYKLYKTYTTTGTLNFSNLKSGTKFTFAVRAGINTSGGKIYGGYNQISVTVK